MLRQCSKPVLKTPELGNTNIKLDWDDINNVIFTADISGGTQYTSFTNISSNINSSVYDFTNLSKGTNYEIKIASMSIQNNFEFFATIDLSNQKITWPNNIGNTYKLLRNGNQIATPNNNTHEYAFSSLSPAYSSTDVFKIKLTKNIVSDYANSGVLTTLNAAEPPTNMTFTNVTPNSIKVNWVKPASGANPVKYKIRVSTDDTTYTILSDSVQPTGNNNSYTHNDLIPGTTYYYKVHSIGAPPNDQDSFPLSGNTNTTLQTPILIGIETYNIDTSGNATAMNNSGRVDISWNAVPGAMEYEVVKKLNNGGYSVKQTTSNTSVTIKISHDDPNGARKQYTYKIRAKKGSVLSQFLENKSVEQLAPPPYVNPNHFNQTKKDEIKGDAKSGRI